MKKMLFFLIICTVIISCIKTKASSYKFYEAETIPNIYITRYDKSTKTYYYQKARFFREINTDEFAYCVEAFAGFYENESYNQSNPTNMSAAQLDKITKIAHYGYGYPGHSDKSWYAVTQVMIWQTLVNTDDVFFTDKMNGNKVNTYDGMINEINNLITSQEIIPSFNGKTVNLVENEELELIDTNNVLSKYTPSLLSIKDNKLVIKDLKPGSYKISLTRNDNYYNKPVLFYTSNGSQNLVQTGNINAKNASLNIVVKNTKLNILKIDSDTNKPIPSGEGKLSECVFGIYDTDDNLIEKVGIDEKGEAQLNNIKYGKYYIKELIAGVGYKINDNKIEFELSEDNTEVSLTISNKIIKKKIVINKTYGNKSTQKPEPNIEFNIFDRNKKLVKTIKTDNLGRAEYTLPYGEYTIKQLTSTEGYSFNNPIKIKVIDEKEQILNLKDYQIEVPNTKTKISIIEMILSLLI